MIAQLILSIAHSVIVGAKFAPDLVDVLVAEFPRMKSAAEAVRICIISEAIVDASTNIKYKPAEAAGRANGTGKR